ncbi:hypothetical protein SteCoe_19703 [Stentor coeruleus]|uniref:Uncharacterized protein n=1 Tax=Stentor coeruleus TaxID=5963 RepID=A0A1R2BTM8_9CILI|nr:hypothetical protein SteCoe_19703 [Stentor coeruleus]
MTETLISNTEMQLLFTKKIYFTICIQSAISVTLASMTYKTVNFEGFFAKNFWLMYFFTGIYGVFALAPVVFKWLRRYPQNVFIICVVFLSIGIVDVCAVSANEIVTLQALSFLFSSVLGLALFSLFSYLQTSKLWGLCCVIFSNFIMSIVFFLAGFEDFVLLSILFSIGFVYAGYLLLITNDLCSRYAIKNTKYCFGALLVYLDHFIIPYIVTKVNILRNPISNE